MKTPNATWLLWSATGLIIFTVIFGLLWYADHGSGTYGDNVPDVQRVSAGGWSGVSVWHDNVRHVTCYQGSHGLACMPDVACPVRSATVSP